MSDVSNIEIKVVSTDNPPTGAGLGETCVPALQLNDQDPGSALSTSSKSLIASASDRDIGRGRPTQSTGVRPGDAAVGRTRHLALRFGG